MAKSSRRAAPNHVVIAAYAIGLPLALFACRPSNPPADQARRAAVLRAAAPSDCKPLPSPPSREMPAELKKVLPRDEQGRPVLTQHGGIGLVYDGRLDDPISRWGSCLERVTAVVKANPKGMLSRCIDSIRVCASDEGGDACCPQPCIDKFKQERAGGQSEMDAMAKSFVEGTCVKGFPRPPAK